MAPLKRQRSERGSKEQYSQCMSVKLRLLSLSSVVFGPLFLIYLNLRCVQNNCVLFQLPLVIPTHMSAYFSALGTCIVLAFIALMFFFSFTSRPSVIRNKEQPAMSTGFSSLITTSMLLIALAYLKPDYIRIVYKEYMKLLMAMTVVSFVLSTILFVFALTKSFPIQRKYCLPLAFFFGSSSVVTLSHVNLKFFFYAHVGLVAWALLDLLIFLNEAIDGTVTAPLAFLVVSQYLVIAHTLLYEKFLRHRPFMVTEGFGFFWLMRVLLYLPFLHTLPLFYVAVAEVTLPKPAILADCVLFLFGFVIYISSIHQKENFVKDPGAYKSLKSVASCVGKRLLVSGYWGIVQKPDYLGYVIIWLSWTIACGFSGLSILVLLVMYATILLWLKQSSDYKQQQFGSAWKKYTSLVPKQIIPLIF